MKITFDNDTWLITKALDIATFSAREKAAFYIGTSCTVYNSRAICSICRDNCLLTYTISDWVASICGNCYYIIKADNACKQLNNNIVYYRSNYCAPINPNPTLVITIRGQQNIVQFCMWSNKSDSTALYQCAINAIHGDLVGIILAFWLRIEVDMIQ